MTKVAVVLGGAECLEDDYRAFRAMRIPATTIAVNDAGIVTPHIDHWVTAHPKELPHRIRLRRERSHPDSFETWTCTFPFGMKDRERICDHAIGGWEDGSSGFLAVGVALHLRCERVVLCGVPMDGQPHFNRIVGWGGYGSYRDVWKERVGELGGVRSMSGWTRKLLGVPTAEWLASLDETEIEGVAL